MKRLTYWARWARYIIRRLWVAAKTPPRPTWYDGLVLLGLVVYILAVILM